MSMLFTFLWVGLPLLFRKPNAPRSWKILLLIAFWASLVNVILLPAIANYLPTIEFSSVVVGRLWILIAFPFAVWGISGGVGASLIWSVLMAALLWWMHGVIAKRLNA
ncbi:MAG: hypothetical protein COA52_12040 [Hyphomicrobiales bacterium]|nr:MAG: hypothetical protein COA52_12040 [Hyphomicrobiales bacterium]